jgi:glyoxylase-like metal-dependent hydrolase (beta-lactamase superfamily II)
VIAEGEWRYWTSSSVLEGLSELVATPARQQLPPLAAAGVLERIAEEVEIAESVRVVPAPGHTPAHLAVEVGSSGGMVYAVDAFLHPLQVDRPDRGRGMDHDPDTAVATRHALLTRAAEHDHLIAASHWDFVTQP